MERIRSALFVDFDNIFGGLLEADRARAYAFAERPGEWLAKLRTAGLAGSRRDLLVCRAYLNPAGWVADEEFGNDQGRVYLQRFRPALTRAGFEVIDCPNLTSAHKNAADIRIVIDVIGALSGATRYDEFILASSDADFTPLFQRLRAEDRRTVLMAAVNPAAAFQAVATDVIAAAGLVDERAGDERAPASAPSEATPVDPIAGGPRLEARARAAALVAQTVGGSAGAVHLSNLGVLLRSECGSIIDDSNWFGFGGLGAFVRSIAKPLSLQVHGYYVWDPERHEGPDQTTPSGIPRPSVPDPLRVLSEETGLPVLDTDCWRTLFTALAEYVGAHELVVNECAVWVRDRLALAGMLVGRREVVAVVVAALQDGPDGGNELPSTANAIRRRVLEHAFDKLRRTGVELSDADRKVISEWLAGNGIADAGWSASLTGT